MEQWRGFLQEGRYEAATTELTRKVIPHVKYIIKEIIPEIIENPPRKDLILVIGKKYQVGKGLPKELEDKMYMAEFTFHIDKKTSGRNRRQVSSRRNAYECSRRRQTR